MPIILADSIKPSARNNAGATKFSKWLSPSKISMKQQVKTH